MLYLVVYVTEVIIYYLKNEIISDIKNALFQADPINEIKHFMNYNDL